MKWLARLLERSHKLHEDGAPLRRLRPLFEAIEKFWFTPPEPTVQPPHVRDPLDVKRFMVTVIIALIPAVLCGLYLFGLRCLAVILVSYAVGGAIEVFFACVRKEEINEGFLVTGLLFPLILPPTIPLWMVAVGIAFAVIVGKELFGGTGRNLFNPALVGRAFLFLAYTPAMTTGWVTPPPMPWDGGPVWGRLGEWISAANVDALTTATPLGGDAVWQWWQPIVGNIPGCIGETSALAIALGAVVLLATGVANYRPMVGMLGSYALLGGLANWAGLEAFGPLGGQFFGGGMLFAAVFMATDPITGPSSNGARWAYGVFVGLLTLLIRNLTPLTEGAMFAVLLGNIFAPLFDEMAVRRHMRRIAHEK